jgi:lysophospholipase L1-like esterase
LDELFQLGQAVDGQSNQVNIRGDTRANQDNTQSKGDTRTSGDVSQDIRSVQERIQYLEDEIENLEEGELKQSKVQELEILNRNIEELDSDLPTSQDIRSVQERIQDLEDEIENLEEGELKQSKVQELEILERNLQELRFGPTTNEISFRNILHIGDSHTAGAYGKELDRLFKSNNIEINTYGCVSATSSHYVNGNLRCLSSSTFQNQVKDYDISEIEPTSLINNHNPDLIIVSLGSNYNSKAGVESGKINEFLNKLSSKTCYWVGAPKAKHTNVKAYEINSALKNSIGSRCTFIDATQLTDEGKLGSDGLHYTSQGGKQWAQGVYNQISQGANLQPSQTSQVSTSRTQTPSQNVATTTTVFELFDVDRAWVKIGKIFFGESYNKVWVRGKGWRSIQEATKTSSTGSSNYDPSVFSGSIGLTPQKIALVKKIASDMDEDPIFPLAIIGPESRGDPNAISGSGCAGVMQVCKTSASNIYIQVQCDQRNGKSKCDKNSCVNNGGYNWCNTCNSNDANCVQDDRFDPVKNIKAGIKVIKDKKKSVTRCVAGEDLIKCQSSAYNAGASVVNLAIQRTGKSNPTWNEVYQIYQRDNVELFRSASSNYKKGVFVGEEGAQIIRQKISATPNYVNKIYRNYQIFKNQVSPTPSPTSPITPTPSSNANIQIRTSFVCDLEGNNLEKAKELDILLHDGIILIADSLSGSSKYPSGATDLKQEILNMYPNSFKVHQASYLKSELKENISQLRIFNLKEEDKPGEKTYSLVSVNNNQEIELEKVNDNTYKIPRNLCMSTYDLNDHSRRPSTGLIIVYNSKKSINIENPCFDRRKAGFEKEMNSFLPNHLVDLEYPRGALKEICS